ncbi:cation-translocating P-type ATPase [Streptomyces mirabilis]|jgi:cation-transporting ATPase E|uniref:cation-translocating P-type ATPase n=1 Tax=Streptomyces TaxID=1883 RepID=UPI0015EE8EE0|nr:MULTISPECIES: cation-translocating P-type ATPase [Streptomyces]KAF5996481.1 magnesium-transporting ATPase [Streptomyces sp. WAC00263]MCX4423337.1 cation-translocating P-type ATPase [Streptomyces mirabilis]MCX4609869.1 cation-translocating P-type ATPase [Streptomyces mirabilis]MCX5350106.1 cation-translocating P-type ATPase [Streptomyces mirabilis]MCZ1000242.1 cation-translocating P-type ATPase [Streptomyces mirabilis]
MTHIDAGAELDPVHPVPLPAPKRAPGLSAAEVAERVARGEVNDVPVRSSRSMGEIVRANVFTRFNAIIGVLWLIMLFVAPFQDSLFGYVIIANTGIGIIQEWRAKKTLDSLAVIGEAKPTVRRDGVAGEVSTSEIVLDDVIEIGPGDKIVVDGSCVEADGLEIDESLLTGEADPVVKHAGDAVMSGSFVVAGGGAFTATKVGREAYAAQLAEEASRFTLVHSELRSGISTILKYVTWMMIPTAIGLVISQLVVKQHGFKDSIARTVGGIVPMVPEGLVLLTSVAFAIGVIRLGRKQCLVQELPAIEGLARIDTVCLDKTGTLTEGGMDVTELRPIQGADETYIRKALGALGESDPRPNASLQAIINSYPDSEDWRCTESLPFSSARKYSGASFSEGNGESSTWLLGAPDVLLPDGDPALAETARLNEDGLRVLLLAKASKDLDDPKVTEGARPTALVVLEQRLRPDAADTLRYFAEQDVKAKVISGDNAVSVGAVAGKLGLSGTVVDARHLPDEKEEMAKSLDKGTVFGRVTPQQKRDMVGALQSRGHTVAMTGDGVNDVLALKDADIGVSMGSGSEATRAVAQIVLLNNSFSTLPSVVAEGRRVIGNITRVATLFLVKTVYSVLLAILVVCWRVEYPFLPRHLTLLSTLTIGIPAFFLALAPNTERARPHFVQRVMRYSIPGGVVAAVATFITYLVARHHYTGPGELDAETSAATLTLFLISMWVLAIIARPYTWWRVALVASMGLAFLVVLIVPWLQHFFALKLVGVEMPWIAVGISVVAAATLEFLWRWVDRRFPA